MGTRQKKNMAFISKGEYIMNIGNDNNMGIIWGEIINRVSNSGLVHRSNSSARGMWTTRLCKSNFPLEDIACNNRLKLERQKNLD